MKKEYNTPICRTFCMKTTSLMAASPANTYGNDEGQIRFSTTEVSADEAD